MLQQLINVLTLADDNESSRFQLVHNRIFNDITVQNNLITYYCS